MLGKLLKARNPVAHCARQLLLRADYSEQCSGNQLAADTTVSRAAKAPPAASNVGDEQFVPDAFEQVCQTALEQLVRHTHVPMELRALALEKLQRQPKASHLPLLMDVALAHEQTSFSLAEQACRGVVQLAVMHGQQSLWLAKLTQLAANPQALGKTAEIAATALVTCPDHRCVPQLLQLALQATAQPTVRRMASQRLLTWYDEATTSQGIAHRYHWPAYSLLPPLPAARRD